MPVESVMDVETKLIFPIEKLNIVNIANNLIYSNTKKDSFENFDYASEYLNKTLSLESLNENEVLISNEFQLFCSSLQQNEQLAKFTLSFITSKIQQFVQQYPNIISSLLLVLIELSLTV